MIRDAFTFALTFAITLRSRSTLELTVERALIQMVGLTLFTPASCACAITGAVLLVPVAGRTNEDLRAAKSTEKAAHRFGHRRSSNNRRAHRQREKSRAMLQHARTRIVGRRHGIGLACYV